MSIDYSDVYKRTSPDTVLDMTSDVGKTTEGFWCRVSFLLVGVVARRSWWPVRGTRREDRPDPIWVPERLVRRVQQSPRCQDETSDTDDVPVRPTGESE
ncbi:hypothetical protein STEG23_019585 [Scotinomys teguina]